MPVSNGARAWSPVAIEWRLRALLAAERSAAALAKLFDEGLRLTEDEACALALLPSVPGA